MTFSSFQTVTRVPTTTCSAIRSRSVARIVVQVLVVLESPLMSTPGRSPRAVRFLACQSLAVESSVEPSLDLSAIVASHVARMALETKILGNSQRIIRHRLVLIKKVILQD